MTSEVDSGADGFFGFSKIELYSGFEFPNKLDPYFEGDLLAASKIDCLG